MNGILLDTSVASLLHPTKMGSPLRVCYESHMAGMVLALSFQSVAELWAWTEYRGWGEREKAGMEDFLRKFLIIPYDFELTKVWAKVTAQCRKTGRRIEEGDAWIVATAVNRQISLLTHDLDQVGLNLPGLIVISYATENQQRLPEC